MGKEVIPFVFLKIFSIQLTVSLCNSEEIPVFSFLLLDSVLSSMGLPTLAGGCRGLFDFTSTRGPSSDQKSWHTRDQREQKRKELVFPVCLLGGVF